MIDRRYNKEGNFNIIFTSNKQPKFWKQCFAEEDTLKCAMDRIFDDVMIFNFSGSSHRGQKREAFKQKTKIKKIKKINHYQDMKKLSLTKTAKQHLAN